MNITLAFLFSCIAAFAQQYTVSTLAGGVPIPNAIDAKLATIGVPMGLAVDRVGQVYFSAYGHSIYKIDLHGILSRIAGNGRAGFSGDGGPATSARLQFPSRITFDAEGNLYIADTGNDRIRKVSTEGVITTIAGNGSQGRTSDEGRATEVRLSEPSGVAIDRKGNLYIADQQNHRVRKVSPAGAMITVAGTGAYGYSGDGGPAASAELRSPTAVAVDAGGNLYIADYGNACVRKVTENGVIASFAGTGVSGFSGDMGPANQARLYTPNDVALDANGSLYIADYGARRIRRVTSDGKIVTVAGNGGFIASGDGAPATSAAILAPTALALDAAGNLYAAEYAGRVRKVTASGILTTVAGDGWAGNSGNAGPAAIAQLSYPSGVAVDRAGNIFVVDRDTSRVRKINPAGVISAFAGNGLWDHLGDGGPAIDAALAFGETGSIAIDSAGSMFIADSGNARIRKVDRNGIITTVAGNGTEGFSGDGGPATRAQLRRPRGVAVDSANNLYIADASNNRIRKVTPDGIITTIAGNGSEGFSGDGGSAVDAQLDFPIAVAAGEDGNIYVADFFNNRVRVVTSGGTIYTVAGGGKSIHIGDGDDATNVEITWPSGIAVDATGNLYIAEEGTQRIRKVDRYGTIHTIAGDGTIGYSDDGSLGTCSSLNHPSGVAVDMDGNVFVADTRNNAIRKLKPAASPIAVCGVVHAASKLPGAIAPGEIVVFDGAEMGPFDYVRAVADGQGKYPTTLRDTRVWFNGTPGPMISSWLTQVSAVAPYNLVGPTATIQIEYLGAKSEPMLIPVAPSAPGIYASLQGTGGAGAYNEDRTYNHAGNPAKAGSVVSLYATGLGQTSPEGRDGELNTFPLPVPLLPVQATVGGLPAEVTYAGGAPGLVAGYMQVNVRVPANALSGVLPVVLTVGSASSQATVTIAVQAAP